MSAMRMAAGNSHQKRSPKRLGPSSACLQKSCRHSGKNSATCTLATVSSGLRATTRCGARVTSVQTSFPMSGRQLFTLGRKGQAVLTAQEVCQHNTLARKAPQVAQYWDAKKNHPLSPDQLTASSGRRAHWKCNVCLNKWQARVFAKTKSNSGCPKCAKANGGRKTDGTRQKHSTFAAAKHASLEQWDHDKNGENGNFPDSTSLQSNKRIWWRCLKCQKGKVHSWQARASCRTSGRSPHGCPFCVGQRPCECNSLETVCPDIAADFDTQKNGVSAAEVTSSTSTKYSWLSDGPGAKKQSVNQRTLRAKRRSSQLLDINDL
jgi:rubrerythrin